MARNTYYVTGTGSGIGLELARQLLDDPDNRVVGISRHPVIKHNNYRHLTVNLAVPDNVLSLEFDEPVQDAGQVVLINNAGMLGDVGHLGQADESQLAETIQLNLVAPAILISKFIRTYNDHGGEKVVLNISSGAAQRPIDGWGGYCSSKAGLDMLMRVAETEKQIDNNTFNFYSIYPGVVDTPMQEQIRKAPKEKFSQVADFVRFNTQGELANPSLVSRKIIHILQNTKAFSNPFISLKEINI